jgi:competence protein ComEC
MASVPGPAGLAPDEALAGESIWSAPLLFPALAVTAGIVLDRYLCLPLFLVVTIGVACLVVFALMYFTARTRLAVVYLHLALVAAGAGYYAYRSDLHDSNEVALRADQVPRPVRLRGVVVEEPRRRPAPPENALRSQQREATASTILSATHLLEGTGERAVSGDVRLIVPGKPGQPASELLARLHPGDEVEVAGRLSRITGPGNPGEFDPAEHWGEQGVRAMLRVPPGGAGVRLVREGWHTSPRAWFAIVRNRAHAELERALDGRAQVLARTLLLDEGAPMTQEDWQRYVNTGIVHVLAISGQHLVVVALFLWWVFRHVGIRQRHGAILVAVILLGYALLTGGRPPALRAGIVAFMACIALVLRWPIQHANLFFLAWIVVLLVDPSSAFSIGCQLSFLSVAVLAWIVSRLFAPAPEDALDRLVDEARPAWVRWLRGRAGDVYQSFAICLIVWLAISPLLAYRKNMIAPAGLVLGPPLTLLTSIALLLGFVLLALAAVGLPALVVSKPLGWCLACCDWLVDLAELWPVHIHVGEIPFWWVLLFYLGLLVVMVRRTIRWRWVGIAGAGWLCVVLVSGSAGRRDAALTCTFLDVGHGGCSVLEFPDGRVLIYDAGSLRGPEVAERSIAPFLWQRGIHRVDLLVLSHSDLDHYNGVVGLVERFAIGEVLMADNFTLKDNPAVRYTQEVLDRRGVPIRHLAAGDRLTAGGAQMDVLHPRAGWRGATANENSLVVQVRHGDGLLLLTGDLEGAGLDELLRQPPRAVDILQAPHHGSTRINIEGLLRWSTPRLVISSQGAPRTNAVSPYARGPAPFWTTYEHGAIRVRSGSAGLTASGYRSGSLDLPAR